MKIALNMINCQKCGIYLNKEVVLKPLLTLSYKRRFCGNTNERDFIYIRGFKCPCCNSIHFISDSNNPYSLEYASEDDDSFKQKYKYFDKKEYLCFKLGIEKTFNLFELVEGEN